MQNSLFLFEEAKKKLVDYVKANNIPLDKIALSFSGGRDSTIMLKMIEELGWKNKIRVVFFNTSMEFEATLRFIDGLRNDGWIIEETKPKKTMPQIYKEYGYPYLSKKASDMVYRLQINNFDFKNDGYKKLHDLLKKYPNCKSALRWWCGDLEMIQAPKWLKRAMIFNQFKIANKCCEYLKKKPINDFVKENKILMSIIGVRKSESLQRSVVYKKCVWTDGKFHKFYPLLFFSEQDIKEIVEIKQIKLSEAYTIYKQNRTGCVGCPYGKNWKQELEVLKKYEPKKAKIVEYLYKDIYASYEEFRYKKEKKDE